MQEKIIIICERTESKTVFPENRMPIQREEKLEVATEFIYTNKSFYYYYFSTFICSFFFFFVSSLISLSLFIIYRTTIKLCLFTPGFFALSSDSICIFVSLHSIFHFYSYQRLHHFIHFNVRHLLFFFCIQYYTVYSIVCLCHPHHMYTYDKLHIHIYS